MGKLPYIYPPAASWAEIALVIATAFMAARVWRLYAYPNAAATGPADAIAPQDQEHD